MQTIYTFDDLLKEISALGSSVVAVANAQDEAALSALLEAQKIGIVTGKLFGKRREIEKILEEFEVSEAPKTLKIIDCPNESEAVAKAVSAVHNHEADILMKGNTKTGNLLKRVLDAQTGLRTRRLLSDAFVFENPERPQNKLTIISDGGVNLKPDLLQKVEIIKNAVELAHLLGNALPKVALLSAVETILPDLTNTLEAAVISRMNQRGQIPGCIIDGPLALDNAISAAALAIKKIESPLSGDADILIPPDIESANMLAKSTTFWAKFRLGHVIMGAAAPILIPSRADSCDAKLLSLALGCMVCKHQK